MMNDIRRWPVLAGALSSRRPAWHKCDPDRRQGRAASTAGTASGRQNRTPRRLPSSSTTIPSHRCRGRRATASRSRGLWRCWTIACGSRHLSAAAGRRRVRWQRHRRTETRDGQFLCPTLRVRPRSRSSRRLEGRSPALQHERLAGVVAGGRSYRQCDRLPNPLQGCPEPTLAALALEQNLWGGKVNNSGGRSRR